MFRGLSLTAALLAFFSLPLSNAAIAGVADNAGGVVDLLKRTAPVMKAQYESSDGYCWYDQGWRGPGWYLCGDEWDNGVGWGGGFRNRHRYLHGFGSARPAPANNRLVHGGGQPGYHFGGARLYHRSPDGGAAWPGRHSGHAPIAHGFGGAAPVFRSYGGAGLVHHGYGGAGPVVHGYGGAALAVHNYGGAGFGVHSYGGGVPAVHSFAAPAAASPNFGGGGSHGFSGSASFPSAAHGGMGH